MESIKIDNQDFFGVVEQLLKEGNHVQFTVKGKSMEPLIPEGTKISLMSTSANMLHIGDVILAKWHEKWVLHRLVYKKWNAVYLVGDNNLMQIEKVANNNVLAIATSYKDGNGNLVPFKNRHRIMGLAWFALRPFRIVFNKIRSIISGG